MDLENNIENRYVNDTAIVEEASQEIVGTRQQTITTSDITQLIGELSMNHPELHKVIQPLLGNIYNLMSGQSLDKESDDFRNFNSYGIDHDCVVSKIDISNTSELKKTVDELRKINPKFDELIISKKQAESLEITEEAKADAKPSIFNDIFGNDTERNDIGNSDWLKENNDDYYQEKADALNLEAILNLPQKFLFDLVAVLTGISQGALRLSKKGLTITVLDRRYGDRLKKFKTVILLDATANKRTLAHEIGINPNEIIEISQEMPSLKNLTVINTQIEGLKSADYSKTAKERVKAAVSTIEAKHGDVKTIGQLRHLEELSLDGYWYVDNRGSNKLKNVNTIVAIGTPRINLGVAKDSYFAIHQSFEGFDRHYQDLIDAEIVQTIGRPRAHQSPDEEFVIYLLATDFDADFLRNYGINVVNRHGMEIEPKAATEANHHRWLITQKMRSLIESKIKVTQDSLAKLSGISQNYVSKLVKSFGSNGWKEFMKLFLSLYRTNRDWNNFDPLKEDVLRDWMCLDPISEADKFIQIINDKGWEHFKACLDGYSSHARASIIGYLMRLMLPDEILKDIDDILLNPSTTSEGI